MLKFLKKPFFFLFYFLTVLNFYLRGFLLSKTKFIFSISREHLFFIISFLKYNLLAGFSSLLDIVVVDNTHFNRNRFEVTYIFWNIHYSLRIGIKLFTTQQNSLLSLSNYFSSANWLEREAWDMFGIRFLMHPNLCRILTDYGFKGFPLRKDYPLSGYIDIIYDNSLGMMHYLPVEFAQNMRFFTLINPWTH